MSLLDRGPGRQRRPSQPPHLRPPATAPSRRCPHPSLLHSSTAGPSSASKILLACAGPVTSTCHPSARPGEPPPEWSWLLPMGPRCPGQPPCGAQAPRHPPHTPSPSPPCPSLAHSTCPWRAQGHSCLRAFARAAPGAPFSLLSSLSAQLPQVLLRSHLASPPSCPPRHSLRARASGAASCLAGFCHRSYLSPPRQHLRSLQPALCWNRVRHTEPLTSALNPTGPGLSNWLMPWA